MIEAVSENLALKQRLFRSLAAVVSDETILASNTSSLSIAAIAEGLPAPGRFAGLHFFNPVPAMKLVEVVSGLQTGPDTAQAIFDLSKA